MSTVELPRGRSLVPELTRVSLDFIVERLLFPSKSVISDTLPVGVSLNSAFLKRLKVFDLSVAGYNSVLDTLSLSPLRFWVVSLPGRHSDNTLVRNSLSLSLTVTSSLTSSFQRDSYSSNTYSGGLGDW